MLFSGVTRILLLADIYYRVWQGLLIYDLSYLPKHYGLQNVLTDNDCTALYVLCIRAHGSSIRNSRTKYHLLKGFRLAKSQIIQFLHS